MGGTRVELVCVAPVASLRKEPDPRAELSDECFSGMDAISVDRSGVWSLVETCYGYRGWALADNFANAAPWAPDRQISHAFADVLSGPSYQSGALETLPAAARVRATGKVSDDWVEVATASGLIGWVRSVFVEPIPRREAALADEAKLRNSLVATARSFLGVQYRWGGKTGAGIDCSGLCSLSYFLNGIVIFRDAVFKPETLREIPRSALKPGDLLYFPGHVGMYLGDGRVIHSTSPLNGVVINSLDPSAADYRAVLDERLEQCGSIFW